MAPPFPIEKAIFPWEKQNALYRRCFFRHHGPVIMRMNSGGAYPRATTLQTDVNQRKILFFTFDEINFCAFDVDSGQLFACRLSGDEMCELMEGEDDDDDFDEVQKNVTELMHMMLLNEEAEEDAYLSRHPLG